MLRDLLCPLPRGHHDHVRTIYRALKWRCRERQRLTLYLCLSDDIFAIAPEKIREVKVEKTILGGRLIWDASSPSANLENLPSLPWPWGHGVAGNRHVLLSP